MSLKAATSGLQGQRALTSSSVSSLRITPFTALKPVRASVRARVAATEEDTDFSFSFSDAKKANEYSAAEVDAALRFYQDGEGSGPSANADFVTNTFGMEDASFFDDIDNDEGYNDEYVIAGIPEAAPKRRGRGRPQAGDADEEDDLEMAKALDKVKALEDRMVLEAAMEEEFGDAKGSSAAVSGETKPAVWDWLADLDNTDAEDASEVQTRQVNTSSSDAQLASIGKTEMFENDENMKLYLDLFAGDDVTEDVLAALEDSTSPDGVTSTLTAEDMARLDALLAEEVPTLNLEAVPTNTVPILDDIPEVKQSVVDSYIQQLRSVARGPGASEADVKAALGADTPMTVEARDAPESAQAKQEYNQLLATPEPEITPAQFDIEDLSAKIEDLSEDVDVEDDGGLASELAALSAVDLFTEEDMPTEEAMIGLEGYVVAGEDWVAKEDARKQALAEAVARGEASPDSLAEDLEDFPDAEDELVRDMLLKEEEDSADMSMFEEDDGENWTERIIELSRVTKVVKGGKIMGFRCVAIVGNQNGLVGVGCQSGREVAVAVKRTLVDARRNVVRVPIVGAGTVPHRAEAKYHAARTLVMPASDGTGCIAGGSVRSVLELAGVKNCLAKRLGSRSALNSARATVAALQQMQSLPEVARARGVPMDQLLLQ